MTVSTWSVVGDMKDARNWPEFVCKFGKDKIILCERCLSNMRGAGAKIEVTKDPVIGRCKYAGWEHQ